MGTYRLSWPGLDELTVFIINKKEKQIFGPEYPLPDHLCHLNKFENKYVEYNAILKLFEVKCRTDAIKTLNDIEELPGVTKLFTMTYEICAENKEIRLRTASYIPLATLLLFFIAHPKCPKFFLARSEVLCHLDGWLETPCKVCYFVRRECICRESAGAPVEHIGFVTQICESSTQTDAPLPPSLLNQPQMGINPMYPYSSPLITMPPYGMHPMPHAAAMSSPGLRCALMIPPGMKALPPGSRLPLGPMPSYTMPQAGSGMRPDFPIVNINNFDKQPSLSIPSSLPLQSLADSRSTVDAKTASTPIEGISVRKETCDAAVQTPKNLCDAKRKIKLRMWKKSLIPGNENTSPITVLEARPRSNLPDKENTELDESRPSKKTKLDDDSLVSNDDKDSDTLSKDGDKPKQKSQSPPRDSSSSQSTGGRVYKQLQWRLLDSEEDTDEEIDEGVITPPVDPIDLTEEKSNDGENSELSADVSKETEKKHEDTTKVKDDTKEGEVKKNELEKDDTPKEVEVKLDDRENTEMDLDNEDEIMESDVEKKSNVTEKEILERESSSCIPTSITTTGDKTEPEIEAKELTRDNLKTETVKIDESDMSTSENNESEALEPVRSELLSINKDDNILASSLNDKTMITSPVVKSKDEDNQGETSSEMDVEVNPAESKVKIQITTLVKEPCNSDSVEDPSKNNANTVDEKKDLDEFPDTDMVIDLTDKASSDDQDSKSDVTDETDDKKHATDSVNECEDKRSEIGKVTSDDNVKEGEEFKMSEKIVSKTDSSDICEESADKVTDKVDPNDKENITDGLQAIYRPPMAKADKTKFVNIGRFEYLPTSEKLYRCVTANCMYCFETRAAAEMHDKIHTTEKDTKYLHCFKCDYKLPMLKWYDMLRHISMMHDIKITEQANGCHLCGLDFSTEELLAHHLEFHYNSKYKCIKCGTLQLTWNQMRRHLQTCPHKEKKECNLGCPYCIFVFHIRNMRNVHVSSHKDGGLVCPVCQDGRLWEQWRELRKHYIQKHGRTSKPLPGTATDLALATHPTCPRCELEFTNKEMCYQHMKRTHDWIPYVRLSCPRCECTFNTEKNRDWHLKMAHEPETKCDKCDFVAKSQVSMR